LSTTSLVVLASALETYASYVMTTRGRFDWIAVVGAWVNGWYWFVFIVLAFCFLAPLLTQWAPAVPPLAPGRGDSRSR